MTNDEFRMTNLAEPFVIRHSNFGISRETPSYFLAVLGTYFTQEICVTS
jgi:hypothetical protein